MKSHDIRQGFLEFFAARGHRVVPSAPLIPHGDPTLLFTNAGMVPFKGFFLGSEKPPHPRAASAQKCLRVSGKHNDLENVGPSPRHHTFFEMLGNFSFGDYFKEEAIRAAWELVTEVWGLPPEHLFATVFEEDDDARELWLRLSSLPPERVLKCGVADNFWAMGDTGPCGPCSEIYVDLTPAAPAVEWEAGTAAGRYLEIWNLVFMQFERGEDGRTVPLPRPSIDTGAGLERLAAVLQGVGSNYGSDLFHPLLAAAAELAATRYGEDGGQDVSLRVIADHLRAVTFLLADGAIPGNEGRGYVLRRILRRAVRHGMRLGLGEPFLHRLVPVMGEVLGRAYPELAATREATVATVRAEEEKFLATLATGSQKVQEAIEEARAAGRRELAGTVVFRLYDTYGLPVEVIREIAQEERMGLDEAGFESALGEQKERSRAATGLDQKRLGTLKEALAQAGLGGTTGFAGYRQLTLDGARVLRVVRLAADRPQVTDALARGERGVVVLDRTTAYAESGGQVGDRGVLRWACGAAALTDTQKDGGVTFHFVTVEEGELAAGGVVEVRVDEELRAATQLNHTATHLLHAALREVLGEGVRQAGSLVAPDRLRFDFTYPQPLTEDQRRRIEERVNAWIRRAQTIAIVPDRSLEEALAAGAMALFGEKYGERVRTVEVPGVSLELCGGCHVANTGEIGLFVLTTEKGIASGVRRIEALTGGGGLDHLLRRDRLLQAVETRLAVTGERLPEEIDALERAVREKDRDLARLRLQLVSGDAAGEDRPIRVEGVEVVVREVPWAPAGELRHMADTLRGKLGSGVAVIGSRGEGKVSLVAAVSPDLAGTRVHAGKLVGELARRVGGGGGGRPDFAQAGGKEPDKLPEVLATVEDLVREQLGG
jgi:alanyl-tRNA synthetase